MRILIVKLSALGDVIHTMPLAASLRRKFPTAEISWLVEEEAQGILRGYEKIDRVLVSPRKSILKGIRAGDVSRGFRRAHDFLRVLRQGSYDIVIDAHGLFKSAVLVGIVKAKRKIGFASLQEGSGFFYGEKIFEDMNKHAVERYLDFAAYLGADTSNPEFGISVAGDEGERILSEAGIKEGERFIAFSPNALWRTKLWDNKKFAALADMVSSRLQLRVVLTGKAAVETVAIEKFAQSPVVNLGGRTDLPSLAAVLRRAALVVSTDSGPMHLAAAVGTPVVAIFGPTNEVRTGPYGRKCLVISSGVSCRPCLRKKCPDMVCMERISAEDVFARVEIAMKNNESGMCCHD